jgi:hypothetical protein
LFLERHPTQSYPTPARRGDCIALGQNRSSFLTTPAFESKKNDGAILVHLTSTNQAYGVLKEFLMTKYAARKVFLPIVIIVWLCAIGVGVRFVLIYENSPGTVGATPKTWPGDSRVQRSPDLPTLLMMVHPHCPSSRASVIELSLLLAQVQGRVNANVLFVRPLGVPENWEKSELWASVAKMAGVKLSVDHDGIEASRFGSNTSGHVMLYDTKGQLLFSGGITPLRGHSGDSDGRTAMVALLIQGRAAKDQTPVFGCPLIGKAKDPEELYDASHEN